MKTFNAPLMQVQRLEGEEIIGTASPCFEVFACVECYCTAVSCETGYTCTGLVCPSLKDFD